MNNEKAFEYIINEDFDFVLEEGANSSVCLRKISWNGRPEKIDIRKYTYKDGEERMLKGISLSDEGTNELVNTLVENGYGDYNRILKALNNRTHEVTEDEEYYDPADILE